MDDHYATVVFPWGIPIPETDFRIALLRRLDYLQMVELQASETLNWSEITIRNFVADLLPDQGRTCIAFDWLHQKMDKEIFWAQSLVTFARDLKIPMVCLPHGDHCHTGNMLRFNEISPEATSLYSPVSMFDSLVVPNRHCGFRYQKFQPAEQIQVLGSPRYNSEWLETLSKIAPEFVVPEAEGKNKILLFLRNTFYPIFWEEIYWTIELIAQFKSNYLVVVPHTRDDGWENLVACYPSLAQKKSNYTCIEEGVYSGSIIKWADVVIDIGTSVVFEAIMREKIVICAEYLHATRSIVSKYIPDSIVLCRDELYDKLATIQSEPSRKFYSGHDANFFISDMVHVPDEKVLDRYVKFLSNIENRTDVEPSFLDNETFTPRQQNPIPLIRRYSALSNRYSDLEQLVYKCDQAHKFLFNLNENTSKKQNDDECSCQKFYRARRDFFMKYGEPDKALEFSQYLLEMTPNDSDFEKHYWLGLKFDKMGEADRGLYIYQQIANDGRVNPELAAWAFFKIGELYCNENDIASANRYFSLALEYNPKHAKAAIFLTSTESTLSVAVGKNNIYPNVINVPMDPLNNELWEYYFSRHKPDDIQIDMYPDCDSYKWGALADILVKYLAKDGTTMIQLRSNPDDLKEIISKMSRIGLRVQQVDGSILQIARTN